MLIESSRKLAVRRRLAHFRQRFDQLLFRTVKVSQFVKIKIVQGFEFHTRKSQRGSELSAGICDDLRFESRTCETRSRSALARRCLGDSPFYL
jgi:hypothetical protein